LHLFEKYGRVYPSYGLFCRLVIRNVLQNIPLKKSAFCLKAPLTSIFIETTA
jgi:hypothetical protein